MKKIVSVVLIFLLMFSVIINAYGQDNGIRVYINGELLSVRGKIYKDNTVIPVRAFLEKSGFAVEWDDAQKMVVATKDNYTLRLWPGSACMMLNDERLIMSCPLLEENGTTYAPVRSIAENTGFNVEWYDKSRSAVLSNTVDTVTYYENTTSLLPELGSVVGGEKFSDSFSDSSNGMCYVYENYAEDKAHMYGDYITSKMGYEYDSMLLGENYSKIYVYTLDDTQTNIIVQKKDNVPYIYVLPDVNDVYQTTYQNETEKNDTDANTNYGGVECYPGTLIPKFDVFAKVNLTRTENLNGGEIAYVYAGDNFDAMSYMNYLRSLGFKDYSTDVGFGFNMTCTMYKGDEYVMIMLSMFYDEVYVVPLK